MSDAASTRESQAGMTLVEVLVVLVLVGIMAGVIGLSIGPVDRGASPAREAQLLIARLNRAVQETAMAGTTFGFVWSADAYRFVLLQDGAWVEHPVPLLGQSHPLAGDVVLTAAGSSQGSYIVGATLLPQDGKPLEIAFGRDDRAEVAVLFDGVSADLMPQAAQ